MTGRDQQGQPQPDPKMPPETLELRARPQPLTRINRKVVIGAAAVLLCLICFIVLLALKPPSLRVAGPQELSNVEHKPVTDALSKLSVRAQHAHLSAMMRGHYAYYGMSGNYRRLSWYALAVARIWRKWLARRDRQGSMYWRRFAELLRRHRRTSMAS